MKMPIQNMRTVDMCILFDEIFAKDELTEEDNTKLCTYLYWILYTLAKNQGLLKTYADYEDFAMIATTVLYTRFLKKKANGEPVDSVLNYVKGCLNHLITAFQNENFAEVIDPLKGPGTGTDIITHDFQQSIQSDYDFERSEAIEDSLTHMPSFILKVIKMTPYKSDEELCRKLYISCLMTLAKSLTLTKQDYKKLSYKNKKVDDDEIYLNAYQSGKETDIVCWHLPDEYGNVILLLLNKARILLSKEIDSVNSSFDLDQTMLNAIMASVYDTDTANSQEE